MKPFMIGALAAGVLLSAPALAQTSSSPQQLLQGLLSGNQSQDQAVRDAFERGYRAGRQDEARMASGNGRSSRYDSGSRGSDDQGGYSGGGNYPSGRSGSGSGSGYTR